MGGGLLVEAAGPHRLIPLPPSSLTLAANCVCGSAPHALRAGLWKPPEASWKQSETVGDS